MNTGRRRLSAILLGTTLLLGSACQSLEFDPVDQSGGGGDRNLSSVSTTTGGEPVPDGGDGVPLSESATATINDPGFTGPDLPDLDTRCGGGGDATFDLVRRTLLPAPGTSSATWARAMLRAGRVPDPANLRLADFRALYAPEVTEAEGRVALHLLPVKADVGAGKWDPIEAFARVDTPAVRTAPLRVVVVVDVSPSMRAASATTRELLSTLREGLRHDDDALGVVTFAGDARVDVPPTKPADLDDALEALSLEPRPGADVHAALEAAYALGAADAPVHVLLVTDDTRRVDEAVLLRADAQRLLGARVSVAVVGKPIRAGVTPEAALLLDRSAAGALAERGGGELHFLASDDDVTDVFGGAGVDRRLGVALEAGPLALQLGRYLEAHDPDSAQGGEGVTTRLAPATSYGLRLTGGVCSFDSLEAYAGVLLSDVRVALEGTDESVVLFAAEPRSLGEIAPDAIDWVETAVVAAVGALRGGDASAALGRLGDAEGALGCADDATARGCASVAELRELVELHAAAVSAGL